MAGGYAAPEPRRKARCAGVAGSTAQLHEERQHTPLRGEPRELGALALRSNPPSKSHRGLARRSRRIIPTSAHHQRDHAVQLAPEIRFAVYVEASAIDGDRLLHLRMLLLSTAERLLPRQQQRSTLAHHVRAGAWACMLDTLEQLESTKQSGHALQPSQMTVRTASWNTTSKHPKRVCLSASICQIFVTACRTPPPTHDSYSLNAETPGLVALLRHSPRLTTRPPGKSAFTKSPAQLESCCIHGPCAFRIAFIGTCCEVRQPCRDYNCGNYDDEEFCVLTQKDDSPPMKVHGFSRYVKERGSVVQEGNNDDKKPTLSPASTTDKIPPPFPGFAHLTDPEEDGGDVSVVIAQHAPSLLDMDGVTIYGECVTSGSVIASPVIGSVVKTSGKPPMRRLSLKKPTCDMLPELASEDGDAEGELMQLHHHEASSQSKESTNRLTSKKHMTTNILGSRTPRTSLTEPKVSVAAHSHENSSVLSVTTCSPPKVPVEPQESIDANKRSLTTESGDVPLLDMSDGRHIETTATDKEDGTAQDSTVKEEKEAAEACTSRKMPEKTTPAASEQALTRSSALTRPERMTVSSSLIWRVIFAWSGTVFHPTSALQSCHHHARSCSDRGSMLLEGKTQCRLATSRIH